MTIHESAENYLEAILALGENGPVRSIDVAQHLNFSKPSVSRAMSLLREGGFVVMDEGGFLTLTAEGLEQRLMAQDLQPEEYQTELLHLWQPSAFYVRQDGSMVFFFIAEILIVGNPDAMGPRTLVCYDSARGEFSLGAPGELLTGEGPDTLSPPL